MSSRIPSPARSQGARTPRRLSTRSTRSLGSPARSGRLSTFVDQFKDQNMESFAFSPLQQNSVLSDNTQIDEPPRRSWWKRLDDNSRDVLMEAMSDNRPFDNADVVEELEADVSRQEKRNFTLDLPDSSGSESIGSIVIPQRKLFTHKENVPTKTQFGKLVGPRESTAKLQKTAIDIHENVAPKKLFGEAASRKTIFPNILSTSVNKTDAEEKAAPKKIFGEATRKSIFPSNIVQPRTSEKNNLSVSPKASEKSVSNKNLLQQNQQAKIAFPAALLNLSPNKTSGNKTLGEVKQARSLFGNKGGKRKNMFAAFIVADAEEEVPEIEPPQVFGFSKKAEIRRRGSSTSYIEDEDWQLLPSSTMLEGSPAPLKKPKLSSIAQSAHEKSRPANYTEMNKSKDTESDPVNISRNISMKDKTTKGRAQENNDKMEEDEEDVNNSAEEAADANEDGIEDNQEDEEKDNQEVDEEENEKVEEEENQEEDEDDNQEVVEEDNKEETEDQEDETDQEEVETEQADQSSEVQNDVAEASEAEDNGNDQIEQNNEDINQENEEYDQVLEQVAEMHREESHVYEAKLNKSVKEIQKVMEMTKRLENSEALIYDNDTGSVLIDQDESQEQVDEGQDNANKSKSTATELNKFGEEIKETENHSVLQDEADDAMELTYEEDQSVHHEESGDKPNTAVVKSMEQDEVNDAHKDETERMEPEQEIAEKSQQDIEQDVETSQQDTENQAEISREEQVSQEDDDNEEQVEDENDVEISQQEDEVEVSQQEDEDEDAQQDDDEVEVSQLEENEAEASQQEEDEVEVSQQEEDEVEVSQQEEDEVEEQDDEVDQEEVEQDEEVEASEQEEASEREVEASEQEMEDEVGVESDQEAEPEVESDQESEQEQESEHEQDHSENREIEESHEINDMDDNENEASENEIQESPNVSHDTTGRNRKVKSPEAILQTTTNRRDSFQARRNTSVRKTKSMIQPNIQPSLRISTGSNSTAEGSGWDSHRVTKKTIRQTFGKGYTPRKSLRALVMEKSAQRQTMVLETKETMAESINFPQANSTEIGNSVQFEEESDHEVSRRTRQTTLEMYLQKVKKDSLERKKQMEIAVRNSLKAPARDLLNLYNINPKCGVRKPKPTQPKVKKTKPSAVPLGTIPEELLLDLKAKPPKRFVGSNASWITKRLYKFLEAKLEPEFDYEARLRAEELVKTIYDFTKFIRRHDAAPRGAIHELKVEMAELRVTDTHAEFYEFFHEFMPREIRLKVVPDIINKLRLPRDGVFSPILRDATVRG